MMMVPYEAFACGCGAGDVVLRESYKPKTRGKLYCACPLSKPRENCFGCGFFMERETSSLTDQFSWSFIDSKNAECSNYKHLLDKITVLKATMEMYMHLEQHTVNSAAWKWIFKKRTKRKQTRPNQARDGKDKVKSKPKSVKVKKSTGKSTPKEV
ncbi:hypothetical protein Tco_0644043 [Tanacetum coccineum]